MTHAIDDTDDATLDALTFLARYPREIAWRTVAACIGPRWKKCRASLHELEERNGELRAACVSYRKRIAHLETLVGRCELAARELSEARATIACLLSERDALRAALLEAAPDYAAELAELQALTPFSIVLRVSHHASGRPADYQFQFGPMDFTERQNTLDGARLELLYGLRGEHVQKPAVADEAGIDAAIVEAEAEAREGVEG